MGGGVLISYQLHTSPMLTRQLWFSGVSLSCRHHATQYPSAPIWFCSDFRPAAYLPSATKASVAVRVCPCLFELRQVPRKSASGEYKVKSSKSVIQLLYSVHLQQHVEDCDTFSTYWVILVFPYITLKTVTPLAHTGLFWCFHTSPWRLWHL